MSLIDCELCGQHHPEGEPHCPNCGQPAGSGFHAAWNLGQCPEWVDGRWIAGPGPTATGQEEKS